MTVILSATLYSELWHIASAFSSRVNIHWMHYVLCKTYHRKKNHFTFTIYRQLYIRWHCVHVCDAFLFLIKIPTYNWHSLHIKHFMIFIFQYINIYYCLFFCSDDIYNVYLYILLFFLYKWKWKWKLI